MTNVVRFLFCIIVGILGFVPTLVHTQPISWQNTNGPTGPYGGDVTSILTSPTGHMFAVSRNAGLFRSTDGGKNWTAVNTGLPDEATLNSLDCDVSGTLYLCTSLGLYSSTNDGNTWRQVLDNATSCVTITVRGTIVAGALYQPLVFRSSDGGSTWVPGDTIAAWSGIVSIGSGADGKVFVNTMQVGVFVSTDDGQSWAASNKGFVIQTVGAGRLWGGPIYVGRSGDVFAIENNLVYKTTDEGENWMLMPMDTTSDPSGVQYIGDFSSLLITSNGTLFTGSYARMTGVERSTDGGATWEQVNTGITEWWIECMAADSDGNIYAGTGGAGIFKSSDLGNVWNASNQGMERCDVQAIALDSTGYLYAGTSEGGVYRSTDQGEIWVSINNGITVNNVTALITNVKGTIFAGTMGGAGVYRTTNSGNVWYPQNKGLTDSNVVAMAVGPNGCLFASTQSSLFRSTDGGNSWESSDSGLTSEVHSFDCGFEGKIYVASESGVYISRDDGLNWENSSVGLPAGGILSISNSENRIFAGTVSNGVYSSADSGRSWSPSNNGTTMKEIQSISVNSVDRVFIGATDGVYRTTDDGMTWSSLNDGLTYGDVRAIAFDSKDYAYAATYGGGVFKTSEPTTAVTEHIDTSPRMLHLGQNYPNPFNPSTVISYQLPTNSLVTLKIYDVLGREVKTLVHERQTAGNHSVIFNGGSLPSGVYFYRLQAGTYSVTRKLVLLK